MKNIFKKFSFLFSFLLIFGACDDVEIIELRDDANTIVSLSASALVLTEDIIDDEVLTVSWTDPYFGFNAAATYKVLIDLEGGDFTAPQIIPAGTDLTKSFTAGELNAKLLSLGLVPFEAVNVDIKVQITLSDFQEMISESVSLTVTPFSSLLDLSTNWGVVGSATPGSWGNPDIPDLPFFTTSETGVFAAYVTLRDGEIKFRLDNEWTTNYGDDGGDGSLEQNGANIVVSAGTYKITVNTNDFSWSMEPFTWGLVGSATTNGWDGPDMMLQYNSFQNDWKAVVTLIDGEVKFRFNNDWGLNLGDTGADGSLENGGDNIAISAGHYLVTLDLNALEYTIEAIDVWGLVGSATTNGWDGPNQKFVPDFGINEGYYYITGAELTGGNEIKVRQNDAWGINYGDDGNDGSMELNGANIPITNTGTYNITLNFSLDPPTIAIYQW
jgi:starch-binding outer membrane protein SusE/F